MTQDEATKVLVRLRTADNALQAARLMAVNAALQARIGNVQTQVRQLIRALRVGVAADRPGSGMRHALATLALFAVTWGGLVLIAVLATL